MINFYRDLPTAKIKINLNKKPIKMDLFLSFLTVEVERSKKHLGVDTGWTLLTGSDNLKIGGGIVGNVEYLDSIMYKKNLDNSYNDFVNPFYLFEIFNEEGKTFFLQYYVDEIRAVLNKAKAETAKIMQKAQEALKKEADLVSFWNSKLDNDVTSTSTSALAGAVDQYKTLCVSTAHLTPDDMEAIDVLAKDIDCNMITGRDTGWFVKLYEESEYNKKYRDCSEHFHYILITALNSGYRMIEFDSQAEQYDYFPLFD